MPQDGLLINVLVAQATAVAGYDLCQNERKRSSSKTRVVTGFHFVGSAAIADCDVDIYAGDYYFGRFRNSRAAQGAVLPDDFQPVRATVVASGDAITGIVVTQPTTNDIILGVYGREIG